MTEVQEDGYNWVKRQFSIEILVCKFKDLNKKVHSPFVFSPNPQKFEARFLNFF